MYRRIAHARIEAALRDTPVVLLNGARQTGKTTLAQHREVSRRELRDAGRRHHALGRRCGSRGIPGRAAGPRVIDEVQRAPALFPAVKLAVDRQRVPGRFLPTGSANVMTLPRISESLFASRPFALRRPGGEPLHVRIARGGFPEAVERTSPERRVAWFASYVSAILQRDIREIASVEGLTSMPRLLQLLATRSAGLLNYSDLARSMAMPQSTLKRYLALFESVFLTRMLPAWSTNRGSRLIKAPKLHLVDTGLAAYLLGLDAAGLAAHPHLAGPLLESFVVGELAKLVAGSSRRVRLHHFRTLANKEVDIVLEAADGGVVGIEVKAASIVDARDFAGLRALAEEAGGRFLYGVVLHTGETVASFAPNLQAAPVSMLWSAQAGSA